MANKSINCFFFTFSVVRSNPSSWPGENGKGVDIPKEQEKLKEEKFKLNQFNLIASDMIALNRSINDVRLDGYVVGFTAAQQNTMFLNLLFSNRFIFVLFDQMSSKEVS